MESKGSPTQQISPESYHNMMITLKTLSSQNQRLADFQERSYQWHLQHHENIKRIITGLNMLSESLDRFGISLEKVVPFEDVKPRPEKQDEEVPPTQQQRTLHHLVIEAKSQEEVEKQLSKVDTIEVFQQLQDESMSMVLPVIEKWLRFVHTAKQGFIFLYEATRFCPSVFSNSNSRPVVLKIISCIEKLAEEEDLEKKIDVELRYIQEIYQFLISSRAK